MRRRGQILAQGIDRRVDRGPLSADLTWADVDRFFDFWAERICSRSSARGAVSYIRGRRWYDSVRSVAPAGDRPARMQPVPGAIQP